MSLTETTAYREEHWGGRAKAGGVGRRMKTRRPGGGEEARRRQRALRWKVPQREGRVFEKAREAPPLAACSLTWENAQVSAAPEQGLHADFVDISSVLKKKRNPGRCVPGRGVSRDKGSLLAEGRSDVGWGDGRAGLVLREEAGMDEQGRTRLEQRVV